MTKGDGGGEGEGEENGEGGSNSSHLAVEMTSLSGAHPWSGIAGTVRHGSTVTTANGKWSTLSSIRGSGRESGEKW